MRLLGFRKGISKKSSKKYCMAIIEKDFSARDVSDGSVGKNVETIFLPDDQVDYLLPTMIGKEVYLDYNIVSGRAFLEKIVVK